MDFDKAIVAIRLTGKQAFQFHAAAAFGQFGQGFFRFGHGGFVALLLAHFNQREVVFQLALQSAELVKRIIQRCAFFKQGLRGGRVVPQIGIFGLLV